MQINTKAVFVSFNKQEQNIIYFISCILWELLYYQVELFWFPGVCSPKMTKTSVLQELYSV